MGWCAHRGEEDDLTHYGEPLNLVSFGQNTTVHMVFWHCYDSQRYQRQSIIFINASCANEYLQKSPDFSGKEKRSVSLLAELIQCTKVKAPPLLPLLLPLLWRLLMCTEEIGLCLWLFILSSLLAINIHIHMKSLVSH